MKKILLAGFIVLVVAGCSSSQNVSPAEEQRMDSAYSSREDTPEYSEWEEMRMEEESINEDMELFDGDEREDED